MKSHAPDTMPSQPIDKDTLIQGLRALGLRAGMRLVVHSSLRSFGVVAGGAPTVIAALMTVVTPSGTILMPSFNHGAPFQPAGPGFYDPRTTPTTNGAIPDQFWRMPGVYRSLDPTHACAAWGHDAQRYVAGHHRTLTMGPQSPLGLLHADGGSCLLLGVDYTANTFHHVVETTLGAPCLGLRSEAYPVLLPDRRRVLGRTWGWRNAACPFTDQNRYGRLMRERGLDRVGRIGSCQATLFALQDCFDLVAGILRNGSDGFPPCQACAIRPRAVAESVRSDWDAVAQAPAASSDTWVL